MAWLIRGLLVLSALAFAAWAYAPYLPRLLAEGYPRPEWPAKGAFADIAGVSVPEAFGAAEQTTLGPGLAKLFSQSGGKALLVYQGGKLKLEYYAPDYGADTRFNSYSMVKSLVGLLTLKAIAQGELPELDVPLAKLGVTERELLDMKSGIIFETDEMKHASGVAEKDVEATITNPFGPMARLHVSGLADMQSALRSDPKLKGVFSYQNVNTALLGAMLPQMDQRLSTQIWRPAGAQGAYWRRYGEKLDVSAYCCLYATARDWLAVARYIMSNGGGAFLPDEDFRAFLGLDLADAELGKGVYRLHAWHDILDRPGEPLQGRFTYFMGNGGQAVYLMPQKDLIVIRFGERRQLLHSTLYEVWRQIGGS